MCLVGNMELIDDYSDHALFWEYEPILRKIPYWIKGSVSCEVDTDDLYQDACLHFLTLIDLGKIDFGLICGDYVWKRIGWSLKKKVAITAKADAILWRDYSPTDAYLPAMLDTSIALSFLGCKVLTHVQKQVLYRFYCLGESTEDVGKELGLSATKVSSQRELGTRALRKFYKIESKDKPKVWDKNDLRIWGPYRPKDDRWTITRWRVVARKGSRGKVWTKFFDSWNSAWKFRRSIEKHGVSVFKKR